MPLYPSRMGIMVVMSTNILETLAFYFRNYDFQCFIYWILGFLFVTLWNNVGLNVNYYFFKGIRSYITHCNIRITLSHTLRFRYFLHNFIFFVITFPAKVSIGAQHSCTFHSIIQILFTFIYLIIYLLLFYFKYMSISIIMIVISLVIYE